MAAAKEEAAESLRSAKVERQRLTELRRRLIQRGRRHWQAQRKEADAREVRLHVEADSIAEDRASLLTHIEQFNGQIELDKRRLADGWAVFDRERRQWQSRRDAETAAAAAQVRDLARRAKAVVAAERKIAADRVQLARDIAKRQLELEQLETRIGNARWRLLEQQAVQLDKKQEPRDSDETNLPPVSGVSVSCYYPPAKVRIGPPHRNAGACCR